MPPSSLDHVAPISNSASASASKKALAGHFAAVYRELVRFIARRVGNDDDARDLAHDTWVRMVDVEKSTGRAKPEDVRAYLFTVAHHLALDHLRRRQLAVKLPLPTAELGPDVADNVMYQQAVTAIEAELQTLPERTRDVFLQHRLLGVGHAELADRYGLSVNMIERDVMLAMDRVQTAVETWHAGRSGTTSAQRKGRRRSLAALLALCGVTTTGGLVWQLWWRQRMLWEISLASPRGRLLTQQLADGSTLTLDADSRADVAFYADRRLVNLHAGAAFFQVAHEAARPFIVHAAMAEITVLGTQFGVELTDDATDIQVESGVVRVRRRGESDQDLVLRAGQAVRVPRAEGTRTASARLVVREMPLSDAATWRTGTVVFEATTLGAALRRLERYGVVPVTVDPQAARLPVSGQLRVSQLQDWLLALPAALPVRVRPVKGSTPGWRVDPA